MSQLVDPFNVNFRAKGVESNGQWTTAFSGTTAIQSPLIQNWSSVAVSSDGRFVIACVNGGQIYTSSDYGYSMVPDTTVPPDAWSGVTISSDSTQAAACVNDGGIYTATLSGTNWSWTKQTDAPTPAYWSSITFGESTSIAACIYSGDIYIGTYSTNNSEWSWTQQTSISLAGWSSISYSGISNNFFACVNEGDIYTGNNNVWSATSAGTKSWSSIASNTSGTTRVFACVNVGGIFIGTYTSEWSWIQSNASSLAWSSIACNSTGQYVVACVNGGGIYCSLDYGMNWQEQVNGPTNSLWSCVASDSTGTFLVGAISGGYIYISPYFQGTQWQSSYNKPDFSWTCVASDDTGKNLIACANNTLGYFSNSKGVYTSNDYGISWNSIPDLSDQSFISVATNKDGTVLAACSNTLSSDGVYYVYIYRNGGNWEKQSSASGTTFSFITLDGSGNYAAVVNDMGVGVNIGYYNDNSWSWTTQNVPSVVWTTIKYSGDSTKIYAAGVQSETKGILWCGTKQPDSNNYTWKTLYNDSFIVYANIACSYDGMHVAATSIGLNPTTTSNNTSYVWVSEDYGNTFNPVLSSESNVSGGVGYVGITMDTTGQKMAVTFYTNLLQPNSSTPLVPSCIYISTDFGVNWVAQTQGLPTTNNAWYSISCNTNMDKLIICAIAIASTQYIPSGYPSSLGIYTSFISETSWTPQLNALPSKNVFSKLTSSSDGKYLAVVAENNSTNNNYGGIWISSDSGDTWIQSTAGNLWWNAIASDNTGQYLVAGVYDYGQLYTSSNYGYSWTVSASSPTNRWDAISFSCNSDSNSTSQYVYAQVDGGYIYYSSDRGITWNQLSTNIGGFWSNGIASSSDGSTAYAGSNYGAYDSNTVGIWKSSNYGANFSQVFSTAGVWNYIATDSTGKYVVAVNIYVGIYFSSDNGSSWNQILSQNKFWNAITLVKNDETLLVNAICSYGLIYSGTCAISSITTGTPTGTGTWTWTFHSATTDGGVLPATIWNDIHASSDGTMLVICSTTGGIWTSSDSGVTWSQSTLANTYYKTAITSSSTGQNLAAIINNGPIYTSSNYGLNWFPLSSSSLPSYNLYNSYNWYSITSSITGQYIVASTTVGEIYVSSNYCQSWSKTIIGANPVVSISSSGQYIVAASNLGSIYFSSNFGSSWAQLTEEANDLPSVSEAWSAIAMSSSGQYMVAAINGGTIYISSNFGSTWTPVSTTSSNWSSIAISDSGQNIVASIYNGAIYISSDYGSTWAPATSESKWTSVAISGTGQYIVATIDGGSIWGSANYGTDWYQIYPTTQSTYDLIAITSSTSGQYLAAITPNGAICIYSNFMDIGNILGSLINELQIQLQNNQTQLQLQNITPTGSIMAFGGTTDPIGWVIMNGVPRNNNGQYNNLLLMGIGTLNSDNAYLPPNYSGAFLRGTGTTIEGYSGPDINTSQSMGIMQHNHSIYDPGHTHTDSGHSHGITVTRTYDPDVSAANTAIANMWNDHQPIIPVNTYTAYANISSNYSNVSVTTNSVSSTAGYNVTETRPYNFGVNWIVKL